MPWRVKMPVELRGVSSVELCAVLSKDVTSGKLESLLCSTLKLLIYAYSALTLNLTLDIGTSTIASGGVRLLMQLRALLSIRCHKCETYEICCQIFDITPLCRLLASALIRLCTTRYRGPIPSNKGVSVVKRTVYSPCAALFDLCDI